MKTMLGASALFLMVCLSLPACEEKAGEYDPAESSPVDAGTPDAGSRDAGAPDAGTDAGAPDAGTPDAGPRDAGAGFTLAMGVDWVNTNNGAFFEIARTPATQAITRGAVVYQDTHIMGFAVGVGTLADAGTPFAGYDGLGVLDARIALMEKGRRPGGALVITLCAAPWWMQGIAPGAVGGYGLSLGSPLLEAHEQDFAKWAAFLAQRYPQVSHFTVWNEFKGYWIAADNHWDYVAFTRMYKKVYAAIKAVRPDAQVGGPYTNLGSVGFNPDGGARGGVPLKANDGTEVSDHQQGWYVDGRTLDAINYFAARAEVDYVTWDTGIRDLPLPDGGLLDDSDKLAILPRWIALRFPGKPQFIMESYWHGDTADLKNFIAKTRSTGKVAAMFLWHQTPTRSGQLWTDAGTLSEVGKVFTQN